VGSRGKEWQDILCLPHYLSPRDGRGGRKEEETKELKKLKRQIMKDSQGLGTKLSLESH
jgi:hypothetical protein